MALTEATLQRHAPGPQRGSWPASPLTAGGTSEPPGGGGLAPRLLGSEARTRCARCSLYLARRVFPSGHAVRGQTLSLSWAPRGSGSAWELRQWPGHGHCGDLPETGILIFTVTVCTLALPVSR